MQVEYCFTAEGNDTQARLLGMRGLDAQLYYRPNSLLNFAHPVVQRIVLDSLRYWARVFHVDGFCLLSAEALAQDGSGMVLDCPAIAQEISQDPVLRACKIIAWPRDVGLLPRGGRRGFPHQGILLQHNYKFGMVLGWLKGNGGVKASDVASQITGTPSNQLAANVLVTVNCTLVSIILRCDH
jgi:pullulanase/glycogen debranching enzyme